MAVTVGLPKRQLGWLRKAISQIDKDELRNYLEEAERCLEVNAPRAAFVLAWSALVYYLRETIKLVGLNSFRDVAKRRLPNWRPRKGEWPRDGDLLLICEEMGIIGEAERKRLHQFAELRNDCAHPGQALVMQSDALPLFEYLLQHISIKVLEGWSLPAAFFEQFLTDPDRDLNPRRAQDLIELLRVDEEYLPFARRLLSWYYDPHGLVEPENPRREEIVVKARQRVPILWSALAGKLDSEKKIKVNNEIGKLLPHTRGSELPEWREFVFWDEWSQTNSEARKLITSYLIPEFAMLVDARRVGLADLAKLEVMTQHADSRNLQDCQQLLKDVEWVVRAT